MKGIYISASGAIQSHLGPLVSEFGPNNTLYWIDRKTAEVNSINFDDEFRGLNVRVVIDAGKQTAAEWATCWV